jgi:diguanylate cyclase (GGDEF)-like protein/PAS domain S-box-containing protein
MADTRDPREQDAPPTDATPSEQAELRHQAEERLDGLVDAYGVADSNTPTRDGLAKVVHELRVHQIELELQNEELRTTQAELDEQRDKYFDLYELAPVGYLTVDADGLVTGANLTAAALLGVERKTLLGAPLSTFFAAEDQDAYYLSMRRLANLTDPQDFELKLRRGDTMFWASIQARAQAPTPGSPEPDCRLTFTDIEAIKGAQRAERSAAERLSAVVGSSHDIIYAMGADGVFKFVSPSWERQLGHHPAVVVGRSFQEFMHVGDIPRFATALAQIVADPTADAAAECRIQSTAGEWLWFECSLSSVFDSDGGVVEYVGNASDITARRLDVDRLQTMAMTDELTSIGNRRQFLATAATEFGRARRHGHELSLLLIDVDHLKTVNDSLGHAAGDLALQFVAEVCASIGRGADAAGRLGGDEFGLLLPHSEAVAAFEVGERLRRRIENESAAGSRPDAVQLTVSIGVSDMRPDDIDYTGMLTRADRALYRAKQTGRNRTCM